MIKVFLISLLFISSSLLSMQLPPFLQKKSSWAQKTLESLTLRQKIGQLFIVAAVSNFTQPTEALATSLLACPYTMDKDHIEKLIKQYHIGGILFLFKSDPKTQMALAESYKQQSSIPLFIAQDSEWGLSMRLDQDEKKVVRYPRNMTLGALADKNLVYKLGNEIGKQCAAIGVHINFAPVVDVNNNAENPVIHDRSFGDNPQAVAALASLYARGLQDAGVIACIKHFPGHGDTNIDSHLDLPCIKHDKKRLNAVELYPFKKLINDGISCIMNAHLFVPALDSTAHKASSLSYPIVTQELKNNLGFEGLVITDGLGMEAITKHYKPGELELEAFLAGNDILLCPLDVAYAVELIEKAIISGRVSYKELDKRVLKILQAKDWVISQQHKKIKNVHDYIIRPKAYDLQKKLYRNAITLVKQEKNSIFSPAFLKQSCIIQIGSMPDDIFYLKGKKSVCAIQKCTSDFSNEQLDACLALSQKADTIIIGVAQMNKFAHKNFGIADKVKSLLGTLKKMKKNIIIIIFGTPYSIKYFADADTIIVAYEDAQEAQRAAIDVLNGSLTASGTLPINY